MSSRGRIITCSVCGQVGMPLVNVGTRREKNYVCKESESCHRRQGFFKLVGGRLCSLWFCPNKAEFSCSCGILLCKPHRRIATHYGHMKTPIKK